MKPKIQFLGFFFMKNKLSKNILLLLTGSLFISSCSKKQENFDIDLSNLRKPVPQTTQNINISDEPDIEKNEVNLKLIPLEKKEDVSSAIKYGKKDPFSNFDNETSRLISDFKLKGFISLKNKNYALVEYKKQAGIIDINAVGNVNTKLLPPQVSVKNIIPAQEKIDLIIEGENYPIILNLD